MANPTLRGSSNPQLQYWEVDFSPTQGGKLVKEYKGIDIARMSALCNHAAIGGYSGKLRYEKNIATLTLETTRLSNNLPDGINSPASDITDKWEISADQEKPELFENSNYLGLFTAANAAANARVDNQVAAAIRQIGSATGGWKTLLTEPVCDDSTGEQLAGGSLQVQDVLTGAYKDGVKLFFNDYIRGRTNFLKGKPLLRHTTSAPSDYGANVADFNVEKIYSIGQLLTECQDTTLWYLPLPGYLAYKILSYPVPGLMPPNYAWGALKMYSGAVTAARNRVEITTEYIIDACPKHTYGLIS